MINYYRFYNGAITNILSSLSRIRVLVISKLNPIYHPDDIYAVDTEIRQHQKQILFTLKHAQFNKKSIFSSILKNPEIKKNIENKYLVLFINFLFGCSAPIKLGEFFFRQIKLLGYSF